MGESDRRGIMALNLRLFDVFLDRHADRLEFLAECVVLGGTSRVLRARHDCIAIHGLHKVPEVEAAGFVGTFGFFCADPGVGWCVAARWRLVLRPDDRCSQLRYGKEVTNEVRDLRGDFWLRLRRHPSLGWLRRRWFCGGWAARGRSRGVGGRRIDSVMILAS